MSRPRPQRFTPRPAARHLCGPVQLEDRTAPAIVDLGTVPGFANDTIPTAVNGAGVVAGYGVGGSFSGPQYRAFVWNAGTITPLAVKANTFTHTKATAVNARGDVLGAYSITTQNHPEGFPYIPLRWLGGRTPEGLGFFDEPNRTSTRYAASDMNDAGTAVGYSTSDTSDKGTVTRLVIWPGGSTAPVNIGPNGGMPVTPVPDGPTVPHLNNAGVVVAQVGSDGNAAAYLGGAWKDLPPVTAGGRTRAYDINDAGKVIGDTEGIPTYWQVNAKTGVITAKRLPETPRADPAGSAAPILSLASINNQGDALAESDRHGQVQIFGDAGFKDFVPVPQLVPADAGWSGAKVTGFGDSSTFAGTGTHDGRKAGFLLLPDKVALPRPFERFSQGAGGWEGDALLGHGEFTMQSSGCVVTSLAMALNYAGVATGPGKLNDLLYAAANPDPPTKARVSYTPAADLDVPAATRIAAADYKKENLHFNQANQNSTDPAVLRQLVADGRPVLVRVTNVSGQGHTVVVTGTYGETFTIADPGYSWRKTLAFYGNEFTVKGYVVDPPDVSNMTVMVSGPDGSGIRVLVTDARGRRVGFGPDGRAVSEIPGSGAFADNPEEDLTDTAGGHLVQYAHVFHPPAGDYQIRVTGVPGSRYDVLVATVTTAGGVTPGASFTGTVPAAAVVTIPATLDANFTPRLGPPREDGTAPAVYALTTFAGGGSASPGDNGPATAAAVGGPVGVAVGAAGDVFFADADRSRVRRVDHATGMITTVAGDGTFGSTGDGGPATAARLQRPVGVAVNAAGDVFVSDVNLGTVRRVDHATGVISTVAGGGTASPGDGGPATGARLGALSYLTVDAAGNLFLTEGTGAFGGRIRRVDAATGVITTVAGGGATFLSQGSGPATAAALWPAGVAVDAAGDLFIADRASGRVGRVDHATGMITTYAGGGRTTDADVGVIPATSAYLYGPEGMAVDAAGNLYMTGSRTVGGLVYRVDAATGVLNIIGGNPYAVGNYYFGVNGGMGNPAALGRLYGTAVDAVGNVYFASDGSIAGGSPGVVKLDPVSGTPLTVNPTALPTATLGRAYTLTLTATGGTAPYTFAATGGPRVSHFLPDGMSLSPAGVLSGTPQTVPDATLFGGQYPFEVTVTDAAGNVGFAILSFAVRPDPVAVTLSPTTLPAGRVGAAYSRTLTASGPAAPYTFTVTAGALPAGLSLSPAGLLSGTPTAPAAGAAFTITAANAAGDSGSRSYTLAVTPAPAPPPPVIPPPVSPPPVSPPPVNPPTVPPSVPPTVPPTVPPSVPPVAGRPLLVGVPQFAAGGTGATRYYDPDGSFRGEFTPFPGYTGELRSAVADFNGDGVPDLVVGTGPGGPTRVRVLDGKDLRVLFAVDPFEATFTGGVYVAAGDTTGDGVPELVITPDEGGGPRVRVFDGNGFGLIADFFGIEDPNFRGGARPAVGDVNGDGAGDLIVAAGFQGGPRVAGFSGKSLGGSPTRVFGDFFAFEQGLRNGVFVAAGDLDGDGFAEVIAGGGPGGGPRVIAFSGKALLSNAYDIRANFFGGDPDNRGGIRLAVKDLDGDPRADLVVGAGTGAGSRVTGYLGATTAPAGVPPTAFAFDAFPGFAGGVFVG